MIWNLLTCLDSIFKISGKFIHLFFRPLGPLHYIRIWHNNLAYDDFASWFLSKMIVKDIQTGEKYEFICNKWLAVEFGDGEVRRYLIRR